MEIQRDEIVREKEEFEEEYTGEDGALEEARNDKGNITKINLNKRIRDIKDDEDYTEELEILEEYLKVNKIRKSDFKKKNKKNKEKGH